MSDIEIITFGCRLNAYESEVMRKHACDAGLGATVIVNTCAVTQESVRQARQAIRKARRENPQAKIVVTGCAAQVDPAPFAAMAEVDHIIGNQEKTESATFLALGCGDTERVKVNDIMSVKETAGHLIEGFGAQARAYVQIQNGCDHRCTFCIIPYGRGPSRSVPAGEVVAQVRKLVENGYAEIVLTGVDITAYGADLPGEITLGVLATKILALVPELKRLRLSSVDSIEADAALLKVIAEEERLMPHLHLSLQAGDDLTLKRMKRRHSRAHAVGFCADVRKLRPDMVFGADLIAGFPTETEDMALNSLKLLDDCDIIAAHVFPFSPRRDTPAARMPQVEREIVKARASRLRDAAAKRRSRWLESLIGTTPPILVEGDGIGHTDNFAPVAIAGAKRGESGTASITGLDGTQLAAVWA